MLSMALIDNERGNVHVWYLCGNHKDLSIVDTTSRPKFKVKQTLQSNLKKNKWKLLNQTRTKTNYRNTDSLYTTYNN